MFYSESYWKILVEESYESKNQCIIKLCNLNQITRSDIPKTFDIDMHSNPEGSCKDWNVNLNSININQLCNISADRFRLSMEDILGSIPKEYNEATIEISFTHLGAIKETIQDQFLVQYDFKTRFPRSNIINIDIEVPLAKSKFKRFLAKKVSFIFPHRSHWLPVPIDSFPGGKADPIKAGRIKYSCKQLTGRVGFVYSEPRISRIITLIIGVIIGAGVTAGLEKLFEYLFSR